jgi:hypothetical protein
MGLTIDDIDEHFGTSGKRKPVNQGVLRQTTDALRAREVLIAGSGTVMPSTSVQTLPPEAQAIASLVSTEERSA